METLWRQPDSRPTSRRRGHAGSGLNGHSRKAQREAAPYPPHFGIDCGTTCSALLNKERWCPQRSYHTFPCLWAGSGGACSGAVPTVLSSSMPHQTVTATFTIPNTNWKLEFVDSEHLRSGWARGERLPMELRRRSGIHNSSMARPPPPHEIQLLSGGSSANLNGSVYVPRKDGRWRLDRAI